jgi:hypothetical protein
MLVFAHNRVVQADIDRIECPVRPGAGQMLTVMANTGYHILDVGVDGASVGAVSGYTFTNVTANHTITAAFAISLYTLNVSKGGNGSGHVTSVPPSIDCGLTCAAAFDYGTIVALTATPRMATVFAG